MLPPVRATWERFEVRKVYSRHSAQARYASLEINREKISAAKQEMARRRTEWSEAGRHGEE